MSKRYVATLTELERAALGQRVATGTGPARELTHARILLKADQGPAGPAWADIAIAAALDVSVPTIERVRRRFVEHGLDDAIRRRRPHQPLPLVRAVAESAPRHGHRAADQDRLGPRDQGPDRLHHPEAERLADRLDIHYTPKDGSWLNIAALPLNSPEQTRRFPSSQAQVAPELLVGNHLSAPQRGPRFGHGRSPFFSLRLVVYRRIHQSLEDRGLARHARVFDVSLGTPAPRFRADGPPGDAAFPSSSCRMSPSRQYPYYRRRRVAGEFAAECAVVLASSVINLFCLIPYAKIDFDADVAPKYSFLARTSRQNILLTRTSRQNRAGFHVKLAYRLALRRPVQQWSLHRAWPWTILPRAQGIA
jgi:hypothetical protein